MSSGRLSFTYLPPIVFFRLTLYLAHSKVARRRRIFLSFDIGMSTTSVAYYDAPSTKRSLAHINYQDIEYVTEWRDRIGFEDTKSVPSKIWYTGRREFYFGYSAITRRDKTKTIGKPVEVSNFKLLLDKKRKSQALMGQKGELKRLETAVEQAIALGYIGKEEDVIEDFIYGVVSKSLEEVGSRKGVFDLEDITPSFALPYGWGNEAALAYLDIARRALLRAGIPPTVAAGIVLASENQCSAEAALRRQGAYLNVSYAYHMVPSQGCRSC